MHRSFLPKSVACCLFIFSALVTKAQALTTEENKLYQMIMNYRDENGLPPVPLSKSLTVVAQVHAKDLHENYVFSDTCNLHSWSDKGNWKQVCFLKGHSKEELMWSKPGELTSYKGNGYEIAFSGYLDSAGIAAMALSTWKTSRSHHAVMLNKDFWTTEWKAIGIGIVGIYAVVWFGNEAEIETP